MLVHLVVDLDSCIGSAECVALDPQAIELDNQGSAHVILPELDEERAQTLCDVCPIGALSLQPL